MDASTNIHVVEDSFNSSEILFQQYLMKKNVDTYLICSDDTVAAHSSILMKNHVLREQIESKERNGNRNGMLEINVKRFSTEVIMVILELLYRGDARCFREIQREVEKAKRFFFPPNNPRELKIKQEKPDSTSVLPNVHFAPERSERNVPVDIKEEPTSSNSLPLNKKIRIDSVPRSSPESSIQPVCEPVEDDSSDDSFVFDLNDLEPPQTTVGKSKETEKTPTENMEIAIDDQPHSNGVMEESEEFDDTVLELGDDPVNEKIVNCLLYCEKDWQSVCVICMKSYKNIKKHLQDKKYAHKIPKPIKLPRK
ncbi:unnamed protein product [Phyllotreta striolata]|uniref:BTB domain-containing protein n=1 Tax=Phyllotreta striolata TaxID=444603 RepID=A0A9N9TZT5_PHYSR|nr:unnamed protein product [Phyllotreta striolata]